MSNALTYDTQNGEVRAVWSFFAGRTVAGIQINVSEGDVIGPGSTLGKIKWATGSPETLSAPSNCSGKIVLIRFRQSDLSRLGIRPSVPFFDIALSGFDAEIGEIEPGKSKGPKGSKPHGAKPKGEKGKPAKGSKKTVTSKVKSTPAKSQSKRTASGRKRTPEPSTD
ncbi:MAG: hypothetical protein IPK82_16885 [Polyangiaceae bacterium]|nr:hypothetical protein [Polyangiaceae bacterium]